MTTRPFSNMIRWCQIFPTNFGAKESARSLANRLKHSSSKLGRCDEQFHTKEACIEQGEEKKPD